MRKTLIVIWLSLYLLNFLNGCAHLPREGEQKIVKGKPPRWAKKIPEDKKFKYFVGFDCDAISVEKGKNRAYIDALKQLIVSLGVIYEFKESYSSIDEFLHQKIKGIPVYTLVREAEIKEIAWQKKEIIVDIEPRELGGCELLANIFLLGLPSLLGLTSEHAAQIEVKYDVWVLIRYPKEEWYRQRHYIRP